MPSRNDGQKPWSFRRRVVITSLLFCAACIVWVMVCGTHDAPTGQTIVSSSFAMGSALIGSYIFAAVWDDKKA